VHAALRELPKLVDEVEQNLPANLDIHVVMDNAATHRTKLIRVWFAKRPPLAYPLHTDILILDQPGRALVRAPGGTTDQARHFDRSN
jgi:transposase